MPCVNVTIHQTCNLYTLLSNFLEAKVVTKDDLGLKPEKNLVIAGD